MPFTLYLKRLNGGTEALSTHDSLKEAWSFKCLILADPEIYRRCIAFFILDQTGREVASHTVPRPSGGRWGFSTGMGYHHDPVSPDKAKVGFLE
jgi:hypothetical protein